MKNQLRNEDGFIHTCCLPSNRCNLVISLLALAVLGALNFWWFLLQDIESQLINSAKPPSAADATFCNSRSMGTKSCNIFEGKWVPDPSPPPYTNDTCRYIFPNQDCMTNGRPDRDFIHWRWQPHDCDIPAFDPALFLRLMTGKSMLFVGDSLARNHMQSLLCQIAQIETPEDLRLRPEHQSMEYVWGFPSYNFTLALAWSPFLVSYTVEEGIWKIHVDRPDEIWASSLANHDIAVFNTLYWFFRRSIYYAKGESISEYDPANLTSIEEVLVMKHVWSNVWKYVVENYEGIAVLRSASVSHFDGNPWDKGGTCYKTQPDFDPHRNMSLPWAHNEILKIQMEEFRKAVERAERNNSTCQLRLLEVAYNTLLRPDGHPGAHRIQSLTEPRNDCTHWCMPGPIDSWSQLLFADPHIMCS